MSRAWSGGDAFAVALAPRGEHEQCNARVDGRVGHVEHREVRHVDEVDDATAEEAAARSERAINHVAERATDDQRRCENRPTRRCPTCIAQ